MNNPQNYGIIYNTVSNSKEVFIMTITKDMSIMARELLKHEEILTFSSIYEEFLNKPDGSSTWMVNTNKLIKYPIDFFIITLPF